MSLDYLGPKNKFLLKPGDGEQMLGPLSSWSKQNLLVDLTGREAGWAWGIGDRAADDFTYDSVTPNVRGNPFQNQTSRRKATSGLDLASLQVDRLCEKTLRWR